MTMFNNTAKIEFAIQHFVEMNEKQMRQMITQTVIKASKMAVMEKYPEIQKMIDEIIFDAETRKLIHQVIVETIQKEVSQYVKDMLGEDANNPTAR